MAQLVQCQAAGAEMQPGGGDPGPGRAVPGDSLQEDVESQREGQEDGPCFLVKIYPQETSLFPK